MKKIYSLFSILCIGLVFSQTILNQSETVSRTVQDPQTVIMLPGFHANSATANPFVAKIGDNGDSGEVIDSGAGATNPSGTLGSNNFHDTQGNIEVNGGGQLQFTLPIALPPGVKSVAPQINLVYISGSGNGIAGYGWNLTGITSISRVGKTIERDGELKGVQLDNTDYYSFNGQRLILKSGSYGADGAEYVTEKFSNVKIKSLGSTSGQLWQGPEYWEVTFEDGSQAWYGGTSSGTSNARTPIEYNIVKWKDAQGNYITYDYEIPSFSISTSPDLQINITISSNNVSIIKKISWGGNETLNKPHFNSIDFNYITRDFKETSYANGIQFIQDKLLNNIIVKTNGSQFKKYEITYKKLGTNYQFVDSITEKNAQDQSANAITFENQSDNFTQPTTFAQNSRFDDIYGNNVVSGDFNGDGKLDFLKEKTFMLSRLDGNNNFLNVSYEGNFLSVVRTPKDNFFSDRQSFATYEFDYINKKVKINYYILNSSNALEKYHSFFLNDIPVETFNEEPCLPSYNQNSCNSGFNLNLKAKEGDFNGDGVSELLLGIWGTTNCRCEDYYGGNQTENITETPTVNYYLDTKNNFSKIISTDYSLFTIGDFNGDGKSDLLKIDGDNIIVYSMAAQGQFNNVFSTVKESLDDKMYLGDFNGDGKTDILAPIALNSSDWRMYISTGNGFRKELYSNLFLYQPSWQGSPRKNRNKQRTYTTSDLNKDGKSDFTIFESQVWFRDGVTDWNNPDSSYGFNYLRNEGVDANGKPIFSNVYHIDPKELNWDGEDINYSMYGEHYIPLFGNFRIAQLNTDFAIIHKTKLITWDLGNKLNKISKIKSITQGGVKTDIEYAPLISTGNIYKSFYDTNPVQYPYVNIIENLNYEIVSKLIQGNRKQDFRYRDMIGHLTGKGMLGFRQTARSTFYADGFENTKVWSGSEMNPLNEALPLKDWSIKTNDENSIFPADISLDNTQLLSYKDYQYKIDKLLNGTVVTNYSDADKPKVVTSINPYITTSKDFQKDVKTVHTVESYNSIYLPTKSKTEIYDGATKFATSTSELAYQPSITTVGSSYSIGKPIWKTETMQVYGDIKGGKEEYDYTGNLLTKKRTYNRDESEYIEERYVYDGFGNVIEKTIENPSNNDDVQAAITKSQYDDKGRFIIKKTDNLGIETNITYNDWGQLLTQTDHLNNTLTNTYDNWGKMLTSKTNLGGTTTYTYEKLSNGDSKVTEYSPDGNQKITYTNKLGQNYKSSVKGFSSGFYVSSEVVFDVLGRKIKESEPYFEGTAVSKWNVTEYDDYSRPIKITQCTGKITTSSYSGRTVTATETNANNRFKTQVFDAIGNVTSTTDKGGTIEFKYNAAGENIESKYGKNIVTTQYDSWGRKRLFNDPSNGIYQYEYNGYGQLIHTTSPKGHKYYNYDEFGRLYNQYEVSKDNTSTKKNITIIYNNKGLITNKSGTSNGQAYSSYVNYDANGRVISSGENSNGRYFYKKSIAYDDKGRITSYEKGMLSSGINTKTVLENVYSNWNGGMYQLKDKNSSKILWELSETNAKGLVLKAKLGASSIENTYDSNNFLSNVSHTTTVNGITNTALQIAYSFNAIKNELNSRTTGGNFNILESFTYDDNNRLVNWINPKTGQLSQNVYDLKGRITQNDQLGTIKYDDNSTTIYRPISATLNAAGEQNLTNNLIQNITYNENNDPVKITGEKGDVYFTYGLTNMRQAVGYGGKLDWTDEGHFTKYYSEDGSYEVVIDNTTGKEKHVIYIGGTPYEANIVYLKNFTESNGSYNFLHKDYLGSILAITNEEGNIKEQRHFDAWGNLTHFKVDGIDKNVNDFNTLSLIDRGYTSHEHFTEVGIIHMNGRLYDPLLRRFLNADENIQDPENTQVYNKYAYVVNNPLIYADVSGEDFGLSLILATAVAVFVAIGTDYYLNRPVNIGNMVQSVIMAAISAGISYGIGEIFKVGDAVAKALKGWTWVARAGAHAIAQGTLSYVQGGNFLSGALSGAFASVANDLLGYYFNKAESNSFIRTKGFALLTGAVSGGVGSVLGGGNFWMGAGQGLIVTAFNFLQHIENKPGDDELIKKLTPEQQKQLEQIKSGTKITAEALKASGLDKILDNWVKNTALGKNLKVSVLDYLAMGGEIYYDHKLQQFNGISKNEFTFRFFTKTTTGVTSAHFGTLAGVAAGAEFGTSVGGIVGTVAGAGIGFYIENTYWKGIRYFDNFMREFRDYLQNQAIFNYHRGF